MKLSWTKRHWFWFFVFLIPSWIVIWAIFGGVMQVQESNLSSALDSKIEDQKRNVRSLWIGYRLELIQSFRDLMFIMRSAAEFGIATCAYPDNPTLKPNCTEATKKVGGILKLLGFRPVFQWINLTYHVGKEERQVFAITEDGFRKLLGEEAYESSTYIPGKMTDFKMNRAILVNTPLKDFGAYFGANNGPFFKKMHGLFDDVIIVDKHGECPFNWCQNYSDEYPELKKTLANTKEKDEKTHDINVESMKKSTVVYQDLLYTKTITFQDPDYKEDEPFVGYGRIVKYADHRSLKDEKDQSMIILVFVAVLISLFFVMLSVIFAIIRVRSEENKKLLDRMVDINQSGESGGTYNIDELVKIVGERRDIEKAEDNYANVQDILKDNFARAFFLRFVTDELAPELVLFWTEAKQLQRDQLETYEMFAARGDIDMSPTTGLEDATAEVEDLLQSNFFVSFKRSHWFAELLKSKTVLQEDDRVLNSVVSFRDRNSVIVDEERLTQEVL